MTSIILIVLCYLLIGLIIGFISGIVAIPNADADEVINFLLGTCVLWPALILTFVIKFIISMPKAVKEYVIFLKQFLIR